MDLEQISFQLISKAGDAFSLLVESINLAKEKKFEEANAKVKESELKMNEAHQIQTDLIVEEAQGTQPNFSILLVHAQDTLMNTILMSTIAKEFIKVYQTLDEKEG